MATTTNQDYIIMHSLWRKALDMGKAGITVPCGSQSAATRLRFALYASVREFRKGLQEPDTKLGEAISTLSISYSADKCSIKIAPKQESSTMALIKELIGDADLRPTAELAAEESLNRFAAGLMGEQAPESAPAGTPAKPANPYYTR